MGNICSAAAADEDGHRGRRGGKNPARGASKPAAEGRKNKKSSLKNKQGKRSAATSKADFTTADRDEDNDGDRSLNHSMSSAVGRSPDHLTAARQLERSSHPSSFVTNANPQPPPEAEVQTLSSPKGQPSPPLKPTSATSLPEAPSGVPMSNDVGAAAAPTPPVEDTSRSISIDDSNTSRDTTRSASTLHRVPNSNPSMSSHPLVAAASSSSAALDGESSSPKVISGRVAASPMLHSAPNPLSAPSSFLTAATARSSEAISLGGDHRPLHPHNSVGMFSQESAPSDPVRLPFDDDDDGQPRRASTAGRHHHRTVRHSSAVVSATAVGTVLAPNSQAEGLSGQAADLLRDHLMSPCDDDADSNSRKYSICTADSDDWSRRVSHEIEYAESETRRSTSSSSADHNQAAARVTASGAAPSSTVKRRDPKQEARMLRRRAKALKQWLQELPTSNLEPIDLASPDESDSSTWNDDVERKFSRID